MLIDFKKELNLGDDTVMEQLDDNKQTNIKTNNLYGGILITLLEDMKLSLANQRIKECMTALLEMGYSKQELIKYTHIFLKDE